MFFFFIYFFSPLLLLLLLLVRLLVRLLVLIVVLLLVLLGELVIPSPAIPPDRISVLLLNAFPGRELFLFLSPFHVYPSFRIPLTSRVNTTRFFHQFTLLRVASHRIMRGAIVPATNTYWPLL